jgi:hypothetical protein
MASDYDNLAYKREQLQSEINSKSTKVNIDRSVFKKTEVEKQIVKSEKLMLKKLAAN